MKKAFTLVELLIVTAILGIMAAIVMPLFAGHVQQAKESTAKDNLRVLRGVIEAYAGQHNDVPPGYPSGNIDASPIPAAFIIQINNGNYFKEIPENPFNNKNTILMIPNNGTIPPASGDYGWVYKAQTKTIKLDFPGTDSENVPYYDY